MYKHSKKLIFSAISCHKMSHYKVFFRKKYSYYSVPTIREYQRTEVFGATLSQVLVESILGGIMLDWIENMERWRHCREKYPEDELIMRFIFGLDITVLFPC